MSNFYIGLMSGSSLDGIDAVVVDFSTDTPRLVAQLCMPIPAELIDELDALTRPGVNELSRSCHVDAQYGVVLAEAANEVLQLSGLNKHEINAIGSHGHTLRHYPNSKFANTLQVGDANRIAELTGITTIADFRRRDMAAGGQGAPLVPAFHQAIFSHPRDARIILNIGGTANLTFLPTLNDEKEIYGFDTGPGNALLDDWILQQQKLAYDQDGNWAASGTIDTELLGRLREDAFFALTPPKSTGRDHFNLNWLMNFIRYTTYAAEDIQATLAELTASTIADAVKTSLSSARQILVCGGGYHNKYLLQRLQLALPEHEITSTASLGVEPDWVEAMAFAWLAKQTLNQQAGNIPAVTGAAREVILGAVYPV